jgi:predicted anti-sigma-YlaC factor YlaD
MLTCAQARDALLEADLAELRGGSSATPLAEHLATCADCRRMAERIVAATDALGRERMRQPRRAVGVAAAAARGEADRIRRTRRRWLAAVPALAAAGIAAIFLARGTPSLSPAPSAPSAASAASAAAAAPADIPLVASMAHTVAVFKTANPNIVVVWQF